MAKLNEIIYMCMDELKLSSDDSYFTSDHIRFLLSKYRSFLLKQRYSDIKKAIPDSNISTICLDLIEVPAISGEACEGGSYLRTSSKVPFMMNIKMPRVYPVDYYQGEITYVSRGRMKYVGYNKYLSNIIYCSLAPDNYIYFKSANPQYLYLEKVRISAVFTDFEETFHLQCNEDGTICDIDDMEFPIESNLIPPLIELVVKELRTSEYAPEDNSNNAHDDLGDITAGKR